MISKESTFGCLLSNRRNDGSTGNENDVEHPCQNRDTVDGDGDSDETRACTLHGLNARSCTVVLTLMIGIAFDHRDR